MSNHLGNVLSVVSDRKIVDDPLNFTTFMPDLLGNIVLGTNTKLSDTKIGEKSIDFITTKYSKDATEIILETIDFDPLNIPSGKDENLEVKKDNTDIKTKPFIELKTKKE